MGEVPYNRRMEGLLLGASGHIYTTQSTLPAFNKLKHLTPSPKFDSKSAKQVDISIHVVWRHKFFATQKQFVNLNDS